jgi:phage host-nuclease inhibitor protein Gam
MKVYLLWGEQGEYSDKSSWVHSVYADAGEAQRRCAGLLAEIGPKVTARWNEDDYGKSQELTKEIEALDPQVREYCYEPPSYSIEEKELITEVCAA